MPNECGALELNFGLGLRKSLYNSTALILVRAHAEYIVTRD